MKDLNQFKFRGKRGEKNLLIITLYPVDYDNFLSRIALQNIDAIARDYDYDGWIISSICPLKDLRKLNSVQFIHPVIIYYRITMLKNLLSEKDINIRDVWLAWGDGVENENRQYLKAAIGHLYGTLLEFDLRYWCISRTRRANPRDASPETLRGIIPEIEPPTLVKFDFQHYVQRRELELKPRITIQ
ncbi:hypothetical protein SAMN05660776_2898 [Salegentibacter holothuriorum]|uniref:Uncharacterized protein n=1 Tax=Salegentibacter holothuriorum TaxID=241145 RepID=A0A1T5DZP1_9FLAO|nr:hypothetical protein [Salegentibacter holothuriorum]SKB76990.1 hypothetical protein SAMN05660776_2898 [Salegentibacter holothuriorum]